MMKKYKTIIVLLSVLCLCVGLYFLMGFISQNRAEKEMQEDIMVTNLVSLTSLEYTDGETTMSFVKEDDIWYVKENESFALDSSLVESMASTLQSVMAVRQLDGADELEDYGLEEPLYTITMKDENEKETTLYIGDGAGENYYATVDDKEVVYTIDTSAADVLEFDLTALEVVEEETTEETTSSESE